MRIVMFYHSLRSDWNHGNAHFLRGVVGELLARGHDVRVYEPRDAWSYRNLIRDYGGTAINEFKAAYPGMDSIRYDLDTLDLDEAMDGADLAIVHELNDHDLVRRIGKHRVKNKYKLLFHDTHHRSVTDSDSMVQYDLSNYDGVLAFGNVIRDIYLSRGWASSVWTWHEAADVRVFRPIEGLKNEGDVVWIGNWGDDERAAEIDDFLLKPISALGLYARVYGVRYPTSVLLAFIKAGIDYYGWLPNSKVPEVFARFKATVHIPRRPYMELLPGIPAIRVFEALACGIPLVCAPWDDVEGLFTPGEDFLVAQNGTEMERRLKSIIDSPTLARELSEHGLNTIHSRHTCAHRVDELMEICGELGVESGECEY